MRILVTGAAGRLGSVLVQELSEAGHEVVATDVSYRQGLPVALHLVDLLDVHAIYPLVDGCDAVLHAGNHPHSFAVRPRQRILSENTAMNSHVFTAAIEMGVRRMVFVSSIQAVSGQEPGRPWKSPAQPCRMPYLPLDSELPTNPGDNDYGLSKVFGEQMLANHAKYHADLACCAVRLPWVVMNPQDSGGQPPRRFSLEHNRRRLHEVMTYLDIDDATALLRAAIEKCSVGFSTYMAAQSPRIQGMSCEAFAKTYLPHVPVRQSLEGLDCLVDMRRLERELGWTPAREPVMLLPESG